MDLKSIKKGLVGMPPATLLVPLSSDFALTSGKSFTVWLQVLVLYQGFPAPKSATDFLFQNNNTTSFIIMTGGIETGIEKDRGESKTGIGNRKSHGQ